MSVLLLALAAATANPAAAQCHKIHYGKDGTVQESWISVDDAEKIEGTGASAHARASGRGSLSSSSSVSVSTYNGKTVSRSSAGAAGAHRSVKITKDENDCTVVIDDRPATGDDQ